MSGNNDLDQAFWDAIVSWTGLTPPPVDPVETVIEFASSFPAGVPATDEDMAREAYPQAYEYLREHLPAESLDAALQWLQLMPPEQYLASAEASVRTFREQGYVSPPAAEGITIPGRPLATPSVPIAGPSDGTPGFPPAEEAAAEVPEDYKQAIAIIVAHLPQSLWTVAQAWLAGAAGNYPGQASQVVQVFQRDGYLTPPDGGPAVYGDGSIQAPGSASMAADDHEISDETEFQEALAYLSQNVLPDQFEVGQARIESASSGSYMMEAMAYVASLVGTHTDAAQPTPMLHAPVPGYPAPEIGIWLGPQETTDQGMAVPSGLDDMSSRGAKRPLETSDASTAPPSRRQRTATDPSVSAHPPGGSSVFSLADRIQEWETRIQPEPSLSEMLHNANTTAAREMLRNPQSHDELRSIAQTAPGLLALLVDDQDLLHQPAKLVEAVLASVPAEADRQTTADTRPRQGVSDVPAASSAPLALDDTEWLSDAHITAGLNALETHLRSANPALAAMTRFVPPALAYLLAVDPALALQQLNGIYLDAEGHDVARYVFVPVTNQGHQAGAQRVGGSEGTHWSLLLIDRVQGQVHHYDSSPSAGQDQFAMILAGAMAHGAPASSRPMALQDNGYDCGVAVLAGARALIDTLPTAGLLPAETLDLSSVSIDRTSVQSLLGRQPAADEDMEESDPPLFDDETDEEPNLAAIEAATPRTEGEANMAYARRLHAAHPGLSIEDISRISRAAASNLKQDAAFKEISSDLAAIEAATPRTEGEANIAYARRLHAAHPGLSIEDISRISRAKASDLRRDAAFKEISSDLAAIEAATPRTEGEANMAYARRLHAAHPGLSIEDISRISRAKASDLRRDAAFKEISSDLAAIEAATPRTEGEANMAYARRLHAAHPGLSIEDISRISRAAASHLKQDAAFKEISSDLAAIEAATPRTEGEANIAYARRLHAAHPGLSIEDISRISRAAASHLKQDAAFKEISSDLAAIEAATPRTEGEANMAYARRLHAAHPGLSIEDISRISRAAASHLKQDAAFKEISSDLAAIEAATPRTEGEANIAYARRLHAAHPGLSIEDISRISRAKASHLKQDAAFKEISSDLAAIEAATPRTEGEANIAYARRLHAAHPGLSIEDISRISRAKASHLKQDAAFKEISSDLAAIEAATPRTEGEANIAYARRLHAAHPGLSIEDISRISRAAASDLRRDAAFKEISSDLAAIEAATPRTEGEANIAYARRLHAAHPGLSIEDISRISRAKASDLRRDAAFKKQ